MISRFPRRAIAITVALVAVGAALHAPSVPEQRARTTMQPQGRVPAGAAIRLGFEANDGRFDPTVKFVSRTPARAVTFTSSEVTFGGPAGGPPVRLSVAGARSDTKVEGIDRLPTRVNDLRGADPSQWRRSLPTFSGVAYRGVLPGVDLVFRDGNGDGGGLEYDVVIAPRVDPAAVVVRIAGAKRLSLSDHGELRIDGPSGTMRQGAPSVYQDVDGRRTAITGAFRLLDRDSVGFEIGPHDPTRALVIDPIISFTFHVSGGVTATAIAVDSSGHAYVAGQLPAVAPGYQRVGGGSGAMADAFVAKLDPTGTAVEYATIFGGAGDDGANAVVVDGSGQAYVSGATGSDNFPTTANAFSRNRNCSPRARNGACDGDAFLTAIDASGANFVYSTYFGGAPSADEATAVALDPAGKVYIAGNSSQQSSWPSTPGAFRTQTAHFIAGFVAKFDISLSGAASRVYATLLTELPGDQDQSTTGIYAVAADGAGSAYVTGSAATGYPTTPGTIDRNGASSTTRAVVTKLKPDGTGLVYSTYLGSNFGRGFGIAVDASGRAYVAGQAGNTASTSNTVSGLHLAGSPSPIQPTPRGRTDAFVSRLAASGNSLEYSTYLGGGGMDAASAIAIDSAGAAYVTGTTDSTDFPPVKPITGQTGAANSFLTKFNAAGNALSYSTTIAGIDARGVAADSSGGAYLAQSDGSVIKVNGLPVVSAISPNVGPSAGGTDAVITGTGLAGAVSVSLGSEPPIACGAAAACRPDAANPDGVLHLLTPPHTPGALPVSVTTGDGSSAVNSSTPTFTWNAPGVIDLSPLSGPATGGTTITLHGHDLQGAQVEVNGIAATDVTVSADGGTISASTPPSDVSGGVPVNVTIPPSGASTAAPSSYTYLPTITGLLPAEGRVEGGDSVAVVGAALNGAGQVRFGDDPLASFTVVNAGLIAVVSPPHPTPGTVPVSLTVGSLDSTVVTLGANMFTYGESQPVTVPAAGTTGFVTGPGSGQSAGGPAPPSGGSTGGGFTTTAGPSGSGNGGPPAASPIVVGSGSSSQVAGVAGSSAPPTATGAAGAGVAPPTPGTPLAVSPLALPSQPATNPAGGLAGEANEAIEVAPRYAMTRPPEAPAASLFGIAMVSGFGCFAVAVTARRRRQRPCPRRAWAL